MVRTPIPTFPRYKVSVNGMLAIGVIAFFLASLPAIMVVRNGRQFRRSRQGAEDWVRLQRVAVSLLIPARNEESSIQQALESILASSHEVFEVLVLDDHSEDRTAQIVQELARRDVRIKLLSSKALPQLWNGKQHACWQLACAAQHPWLLFLDADVRLTPDAITRCLLFQSDAQAPLVSGFPRQITQTWSEKMMIPVMYHLLLGYLPMDRMRKRTDAGLAAGCGQLFLAQRDVYFEVQGHQAIRNSRHDGIQLPRAFRSKGFRTDVFDASDITQCRMYASWTQVVNGLLKNATEGVGHPRLILPFSILLIGGSVLPCLALAVSFFTPMTNAARAVLLVSATISYIPHWLLYRRFGLSRLYLGLAPLSIAWFVCLQWTALFLFLMGRKVSWRGRA